MSDRAEVLNDKLIAYITAHPDVSSGVLFDILSDDYSYPTIKRALRKLVAEKMLSVHGVARATRYSINPLRELSVEIDADEYFSREVDQRNARVDFNQELISGLLPRMELFSEEERVRNRKLLREFRERITRYSFLEFRGEFQRLAIDLSWKSSQIEGNTYSLLETERLLINKETAAGKTQEEAAMLLNHKTALDFILDHENYVQPLTVKAIEDIHSMLMRDLNVSRNIRNRRVGISGTNYRPLDNEFQIREALEEMCTLVNSKTDALEKAFLVLLLISYIQPFADGNKRSARIISNAILMNEHHCPLSFRTVSPLEYKKAMLIFYEQNNISAFKRIFLEQYAFAVDTYF
jgi:Fic family protein